VKYNPRETGFYIKIHHIISDGLTFHILIKEINRVYEALESGNDADARLNPSYLQYVLDEHKYLKSPQVKKDMAFWLDNILPLPPVVNLSAAKTPAGSINAAKCKLVFPDPLRQKMLDYCSAHKTTLYKLILSALSIYISRVSTSSDVVIGTLSNNRSMLRYVKTTGCFISFIPLRIPVAETRDFQNFVQTTGRNLDNIIQHHQRYPFEVLSAQIKEITGVDTGYFYNINLIGYPDMDVKSFTMERRFTGFEGTPLTVYVNRSNRNIHGVLELDWVYQVQHFTGNQVRRMHQCLVDILNDALDRHGEKISQLKFEQPLEVPQKDGGKINPGEIEGQLSNLEGITQV
ncbi:MAG: hypothetical protein GY940_10990, partial [bacterium]|nr:hypothetical protein [bacterium]